MSTDRVLHYDITRRRLWVAGQRCHHGATGALVVAAGVSGLAVRAFPVSEAAALATAGTLLMLHDWKDRALWFQRGWGTQP